MTSGGVVLREAKENIAGGLHHLLSFHHPPALISVIAKLAAEPLQYRMLSLLELKKQRLAISGHKQSHAAERSNRAHSNGLEC